VTLLHTIMIVLAIIIIIIIISTFLNLSVNSVYQLSVTVTIDIATSNTIPHRFYVSFTNWASCVMYVVCCVMYIGTAAKFMNFK